MKDRLVIVTGANGFIGQILTRRLLLESWKVRGVIRAPHVATASQSVIVGNIGPDTDWRVALSGGEAVIHLAACVHVMDDRGELNEFRTVNVEGTRNLFHQAVVAGVKRFIYVSSIKVNGEETISDKPFTEQHKPAPLDPYGISKHEAEECLRLLAQETGIELVIIRPPLVYGPGVKANFLTMMHWLYKRVPLPLGSTHNQRSFISIYNLVDFIVTCLKHPAAANQTFLVSDGEDLSTSDLMCRMATVLNVPGFLFSVHPRLLRQGFLLLGKPAIFRRLCGNLQVDISKARTVLGWEPPVSVDEGLRRTAAWYLEEYGKR